MIKASLRKRELILAYASRGIKKKNPSWQADRYGGQEQKVESSYLQMPAPYRENKLQVAGDF